MSSLQQSIQASTYVGLDVSKLSISATTIDSFGEITSDRFGSDEASIRRYFKRLSSKGSIATCYEAGPTGYELYRLLTSLGIICTVVAPALVPKSPGDRVKTDKRDSIRLVRLFRAGELCSIRVPTLQEEAVRDLCRTRRASVKDIGSIRKRLLSFLLRNNRIYSPGSHWTNLHRQWIETQKFSEPAAEATFNHLRGVLQVEEVRLKELETLLIPYLELPPFKESVKRLICYKGVGELGALTIVSEICDFERFQNARSFMGFVGLGVSEYSSGQSVRRGHITHCGNHHVRTQLIE